MGPILKEATVGGKGNGGGRTAQDTIPLFRQRNGHSIRKSLAFPLFCQK
jgi:hypothetical protein